MRQKWILILMALAMVGLVANCGSSSKKSSACTGQDDCGTGEICDSGKCAKLQKVTFNQQGGTEVVGDISLKVEANALTAETEFTVKSSEVDSNKVLGMQHTVSGGDVQMSVTISFGGNDISGLDMSTFKIGVGVPGGPYTPVTDSLVDPSGKTITGTVSVTTTGVSIVILVPRLDITVTPTSLSVTHNYGSSPCPQEIGTVTVKNNETSEVTVPFDTGQFAVSVDPYMLVVPAGGTLSVKVLFSCDPSGVSGSITIGGVSISVNVTVSGAP